MLIFLLLITANCNVKNLTTVNYTHILFGVHAYDWKNVHLDYVSHNIMSHEPVHYNCCHVS